MGLTGPKSGDYRGQDERIETDKGIDSSAEEERKVAPAVMGLGCLGTTGGLTCGRQAGLGEREGERLIHVIFSSEGPCAGSPFDPEGPTRRIRSMQANGSP